MRADYKYDVFGNRIEEDVDPDGAGPLPTVTTRYAYAGQDLWADLNSTNNLVTQYIHSDRIDQIGMRIGGAGTAWYLTDRLGNVRNMVDSTGAVQDTVA